MSKMFIMFIMDAGALFIMQLLQFFGLDYYIMIVLRDTSYFSHPNVLFLVMNIALTFMFCFTLFNCYKEFRNELSKRNGQAVEHKRKYNDYVNCITWGAYVILLFSKIVLISNKINSLVSMKDFMGPQVLKLLIALSGIIFYLLVSAECIGRRVNHDKWPTNAWIIEIFDSVEILSIVIFTHYSIGYKLECIIYATAFLNFLLPVWILYSISQPDDRNGPLGIPQPLCYNFLHLLLVQMPFLGIRLYMWIKYDQNASVFIMKNILHLIYFMHSQLYPHLIEIYRKNKYSPESRVHEGEPEIIMTNRKGQLAEESVEIL